MEFAAAALSSIGTALGIGGTTAAATTATTAATTAATAATTTAATASTASGLSSLFSMSTLGSILSGVATIGSAMAAGQAGKSNQTMMELQAGEVEAEIPNQQVEGLARRNSIRDKLLESIAERNVAYAASGLDLSFGTPAVAQRQAMDDAGQALAIDQGTEDYNVAKLKRRASLYRMQGLEARRGGLAKQAALLTGGAVDLVDRYA